MSKKNIVSIEDRIPKLKQARKKKANRRLIFYLSVFFFLISIIVYLQSPLSNVKTIEVKGNTFLTKEEIIAESGLNRNTNIWSVDKEEIKQKLLSNPIINSVAISRDLPSSIEIELKEHELVGYVRQENNYVPILGNGSILKSMKRKTFAGNAPLLVDFKEKAFLQKMTSELQKLPNSLLKLISEIHWVPVKGNKDKILLYMNDGFLVDGTIRSFASKMEVYPSIVSQLDKDSKGIIHIGVGAYFESFNKEKNEEDEAEE
ncbi:cell division protein FtsQ/DivIB [Virgibacillus sp. SK37]|uniref:cell division protein FtsQ/DivIB n=1 Tax=Virgibacillus sp. SK37 TaxID=403957 RepID=UPI0004D167BD|nr:cell division protein FtsQ/DivIB [Virgibacillus sp. SK37]AIF43842.1 cell division protein FtsQ [Virgibacillus sp. SK37]